MKTQNVGQSHANVNEQYVDERPPLEFIDIQSIGEPGKNNNSPVF